jgi:hypothetical protein
VPIDPVAMISISLPDALRRVLGDLIGPLSLSFATYAPSGAGRGGRELTKEYGYGALGTDRYPPFTLQEVPDYPAHLEIEYPDNLSRELVLVKWWLLAIPHYLVLGFFLGEGLYLTTEATAAEQVQPVWEAGLIGLLAVIAAIILLFTGRYPQPIYDFVLGIVVFPASPTAMGIAALTWCPPRVTGSAGPRTCVTRVWNRRWWFM